MRAATSFYKQSRTRWNACLVLYVQLLLSLGFVTDSVTPPNYLSLDEVERIGI